MNLPSKLKLLLRAAVGDLNSRSVVLWRLRRADYLLYEHALLPHEIVYDVGGYVGDWTAAMRKKYACHFHIFEPHPESVQKLRERFVSDKLVHIYDFAVEGESRRGVLSSNKEGSVVLRSELSHGVQIYIKDICDIVNKKGHFVSLMKLNIEGSEYTLLEKLLRDPTRHRIKSLLVQFHYQGPSSPARYEAIAAELKKTHSLLWRFPFLWELWTSKHVRKCADSVG